MATQIQTTAGDVFKAYDRKIPGIQRRYDEDVAMYKAAKDAWFARSAWYRFWHPSEAPYRWYYVADSSYLQRINEERSFYAGLTPETTVLVDEQAAMYLGLCDER